MPFTGMSAIPAVEKAAIPQYKAFPYDVIAVPSAPRSPKYTPAENNIHKMIKRKVILIMGVCISTSRTNLRLFQFKPFLILNIIQYSRGK
jgi:hypothetical protein